MKYFKVTYTIGKNNEYQYPEMVKGVVWNVTQYHYKDNIMIGGTEKEIVANGQEVVALPENEALTLIEEYRKSYPEISEEELSSLRPGKEKTRKKREKKPRK